MSDAAYGNDDRLALEEERSLPWLESGLEDEDEDAFDTRRIVVLCLIALAAMIAIVGAIWFLYGNSGDPAETASGEVIAAPDGPYKIAPEHRGGREFDRTGDSAPTAAEGQTQQAQLAGGSEVDTPTAPAESQAPASGVGVQVGAYRSRNRAEQAWAELSANGPLQGRNYRIEEARADIGTVFRLQALAPNASQANALCGELRSVGIDCQVRD
ncbi:hypothetical protein GCM10010923_18460 [Blastomonas marina]|uniref:SPOR domain-containing protein n=1 Tax=Blastomonas marina TaxID=1867408 RepID=A0ABQ1FER2_9SPHN|nr:SPOR domain-containing protein [Blastomonas marina]GGA08534.1 hypothetical protein GCM10010923_18460 [Blastomonas marina]